MKILLTGANGYVGKRLLYSLVNAGHEIVCAVRKKKTFNHPLLTEPKVSVVEVDFLNEESLTAIPEDLDIAYYLIHSMSDFDKDFDKVEASLALNFRRYMDNTTVKQVIYLGGIVNDQWLSRHLKSRLQTEEILRAGGFKLTVFRAGIILGSGSASFEIMRDLVEKLLVMVAPKWLNTKSQPIAVRNVLEILCKAAGRKKLFNRTYDIGGPEVMTYKEMLLRFAEKRGLKRWIFTVPVLSPRLSSYWLYMVTSTSHRLAANLVDSMSVTVIGKKNNLMELLDIQPISFDEAIDRAFSRIKQNHIISSWKDSGADTQFYMNYDQLVEVPQFGCLKDEKTLPVKDVSRVQANIWSLGGDKGWYFGNWLWKLRGYLDKLVGGVGLRRGRTHPTKIQNGDSLDFWRVLVADKQQKRLLLFAEMKLPGEAWLEFKIDDNQVLHQTATFRPHGLAGRLYWLLVLPFHYFVFNGMIRGLATQG